MIRPESVGVGREAPDGSDAGRRHRRPGDATSRSWAITPGSRSRPTPGSSSHFGSMASRTSRLSRRRCWIERCTFGGIRASQRSSPPATHTDRTKSLEEVLRDECASIISCHGVGSCRRRQPSEPRSHSAASRPRATPSGAGSAGRHVQLDDLGRPLHRYPAQGHRGVRQDRPADPGAGRQRRRVRQAQGGQGRARHDLGRRPVGARRVLR